MDRLLEATYRAENQHFWFKGLARFSDPLIRQALTGIAHPRILDCGCGTGANMKRLSAYGRVAGFDLSWDGLQFAHSYDQRRLARATILAIPFRDESFDLVTAFDVLACLDADQEGQALREMHRVVRRGGSVLVNTAALPVLKGQHAVFGSEVRRATKAPLARALERAGFDILRLTYTNFSLLPLVTLVRLSQRFIGLSTSDKEGADISIPPAPLNSALSALVTVEARLLQHVDMPLGSSLLALARKRA